MNILSQIRNARKAFMDKYNMPPLSIFLTEEELRQLNIKIRENWIRDRTHNIRTAMRPDLLPANQPPEDRDFGDVVFGMTITQKETFLGYHLA